MFASRVLPGAPLVRATRRRTSALISVDLPTFDRPTSAVSGAPSRGKSSAPAALRTKVAAIFTGFGIRDSGFGGTRSAANPCESPVPTPESRLVSNGVVDDGAADRLRLGFSRQAARQRFGQRDLQDLVHRLDHVDVQRVEHVLGDVRQVLLVVLRQA